MILLTILYHPDFNSIVNSDLPKRKSAKKNVTFNLDLVELLVKETCDSINQEEWRKITQQK